MVDYANSSIESLLLTILVSILVVSPFLIASIISKEYRHPLRLRADLASFSSGIFIGTITFSIIEESVKLGDIFTMGVGFGIGAVTFSLVRYKIESQPTLFTNKVNDKQNIADSNTASHDNSVEKIVLTEKQKFKWRKQGQES
jgi:hypothetical protein